MAWNKIPAKDDANLTFQPYYARTNILYPLLEPTGKMIFDAITTATDRTGIESPELKKSALVSVITCEIIHALALREITAHEPEIGEWFVHSGTTIYRPLESGNKEALISLPARTITGTVRDECNITASAYANMTGHDDVSFVIGRLISYSKFDLVVAGYREPSPNIARIQQTKTSRNRSSLTDLAALATGHHWADMLPAVDIFGATDEDLLYLAMMNTISRFQATIERQGGWKLLYDDSGKVLHERQHQGMFQIFSRLTFGALRIHLDANPDHGSGATDFTARLNDATAIIEFKKDDKIQEVRHGILTQLPMYMKSAQASQGYYIVMCHRRNPEEVAAILRRDAEEDFDPRCPEIKAIVVDCRRRISASKAPTQTGIAD
ncbi:MULTISPECIES: hypothetical protein [Streptomyces]|uniref:hypothetical protein n=1 Tax=Streptomyces lycopersici TaxID=2974589 RepID=UPI0021CE4F99|nr:hypothetical protein [Streptomyces sp. NEAU-383]